MAVAVPILLSRCCMETTETRLWTDNRVIAHVVAEVMHRRGIRGFI
jgi:hypothetical protein